MTTNIDRFKNDLARLIARGHELQLAMHYECDKEGFTKAATKMHKDKTQEYLSKIPKFKQAYQPWYTEALALLRQLIPERVADFARYYEKPKTRKELGFENYRIEDYLQGLIATRGPDKKVVVDTSAAITHFEQQLAIVEAAESRFESSLFEIRQLVQADLLDSEIEAAELLIKHKFARAAGALAGVVLERHLAQVCSDRNLTTGKKNPTISDFNEALKAASAIDLPQWRFIQHLADIRNLCDHSRQPEPTNDQVIDLIGGVKRTIKSVY